MGNLQYNVSDETWFEVQGILKLGQSREEKLRKVALKVDEADISFALQVHNINLTILFVLIFIH